MIARKPASSNASRHNPAPQLGLAVAAAFALVPALAQAQAGAIPGLPNRSVVIVVPNAAGGPSDLIGRIVAPKLSEAIRQNVIIDNRPSNNGIVAGEIAARGPADGSMLAVGNTGTHAINATLYRSSISYDTLKDFAPITVCISSGLVAAANPKLPAESIKELIAYAKTVPGKINIAIAGATGEIATNALKLLGGIDMNNVNYKGGAPAVIAVISNEAQLTLTNLSNVDPHAKAGKMKIIGVTSGTRDPLLPNVPTFAENGLAGFDVSMWYGFLAPAKTPPAIVQGYYREITKVVAIPEIRERLVTLGYEIHQDTPEQAADRIKRDYERYRKVILDSGMKVE